MKTALTRRIKERAAARICCAGSSIRIEESWPRTTDRQFDLAALRQLLPRSFRPLREGDIRYRGYVRYMDDMVIWGKVEGDLKTPSGAAAIVRRPTWALAQAIPSINRTTHGLDFFGVRLYSDTWILNRRSRVRFQPPIRATGSRDLRTMANRELEYRQRATPRWRSYGEAVSSWKFRQKVLIRELVSGLMARTE